MEDNNQTQAKKLTAPFNFVPLGKYVYYPSWGERTDYDRPLRDGLDGCITVKMKNVSPLCIPQGMPNCDASQWDGYSAHIGTNKEPRYFLPGASLRGMWRSCVEALSFSRLHQYNNRAVFYRDFKKEDANGKKVDTAYAQEHRQCKAGWLKKEKDGKWYLYPCEGDYKCIWLKKLDAWLKKKRATQSLAKYDRAKSELSSYWQRNAYVKEVCGKMFPEYPVKEVNYRIVCTGMRLYNVVSRKEEEHPLEKFEIKRREFLFPDKRGDRINVDSLISLLRGARQGKDFNKYMDDGNEIAVFYLTNEQGGIKSIKSIGLSQMIKERRKYTVRDLVEREQKNVDEERLDMCELLFGTNRVKGIPGKVQVGNAFYVEEPEGGEKVVKMKRLELRQPSPTYHPLYVRQDKEKGSYSTYDDADAVMAGRKHYRIRKEAAPKEREGQDKVFYPLKEGHVFECRLNIYNMCPAEIGALLSAITLHNHQDECYHSVGMGKNWGLGKLEIGEVTLKFTDDKASTKVDDYLEAFESEMDKFVRLHPYMYGDVQETTKWKDTRTVRQLLAIKRQHSKEDCDYMTDYRIKRKDENFAVLEEEYTKKTE